VNVVELEKAAATWTALARDAASALALPLASRSDDGGRMTRELLAAAAVAAFGDGGEARWEEVEASAAAHTWRAAAAVELWARPE